MRSNPRLAVTDGGAESLLGLKGCAIRSVLFMTLVIGLLHLSRDIIRRTRLPVRLEAQVSTHTSDRDDRHSGIVYAAEAAEEICFNCC
jgi:hypothetical protein